MVKPCVFKGRRDFGHCIVISMNLSVTPCASKSTYGPPVPDFIAELRTLPTRPAIWNGSGYDVVDEF